MKLGDKITVTVDYSEFNKKTMRYQALKRGVTGKVVYIHPKNRFCVMEVQLPGGSYRETVSC